MIGVEDHVAGGIELARLLLHVGRELERSARVGGRRRDRVDLEPPGLDERARSVVASTCASANCRSGTVTVYCAVQIEGAVLAVAEVAAVQRAGRLSASGVAGHRAVEHGGAGHSACPASAAERRRVRRLDVILQVRRRVRSSASRPEASTFTSGPADAGASGRRPPPRSVPSTSRRVDLQAADRGLLQRHRAVGGDRVRRDRRDDVGDRATLDVHRAA